MTRSRPPRQPVSARVNAATQTEFRSRERNAAIIAQACRLIEESEEEPSLNDLAKAVGRSPSYFHRMFKAITGLTPKDYAVAHRAGKVPKAWTG